MSSNLLVSVSTVDGVGVITMNRPAARNALSAQLIDDLLVSLRECDGDTAVSALVLTGGDKFFCGTGGEDYPS